MKNLFFVIVLLLFISELQGEELYPAKFPNGKWGYINQSGESKIDGKYDETRLFYRGTAFVKKDGLFGIIDKNGKEISPFSFSAISKERHNRFNIVFVQTPGSNLYGIIDRKGNWIQKPFLKKYSTTWDHLGIGTIYEYYYVDNVTKEQFTYIDTSGKILSEAEYEDLLKNHSRPSETYIAELHDFLSYRDKNGNNIKIEPYGYGEGKYAVNLNNKYGYLNTDGEWIIEAQYDNALAFQYGYAAVEKDIKWGMIDSTGKIITPIIYERIDPFISGYAWVKIKNKWAYIKENKLIIDQIDDKKVNYEYGYSWVKINNKWGYINLEGKFLINPKYDKIDAFAYSGRRSEQYSRAKLRDSSYFISLTGIISPDITEIELDYANSRIELYGIARNSLWLVLPQYHDDDIRYNSEGFILALINYKYGYYDSTGHLAIKPVYSHASGFSENMAAVADDNELFGYIDKKGNYLIKPQFEDALDFNLGFAAVAKNEKWGLIDKEGKFVTSPMFEYIEDWDANYIIFVKNDKVGLADHTGNIIAQPVYKYITIYDKNFFHVELDNKEGYINGKGEWIWKAF